MSLDTDKIPYFYSLKNRIICRLQKNIYKDIKIDLDTIEVNNNYNLLLQRACAKIFIEQYKDAIKDFSEIINAQTNINKLIITGIDYSNILLLRAYAYYLNKQYNNAKKDISCVLTIDKDNVFAKNLQIFVNSKEKSYENLNNLKPFINLIIDHSISYVNKLIAVDNTNYKCYLYLAIILLVKENDPYIYFNLFINLNYEQIIKKNKSILDNLIKASELNKTCKYIYALIGLVKYFIFAFESNKKESTNESTKENFKYFDKALQLDSSFAEVYFYRALINLNVNFDKKQALDDIEKCVILTKENKYKYIYYFDLIEIKYDFFDPFLAIEFSKKIIELAPNSNASYFAHFKILQLSFPPYYYGTFTTNKDLINSYEYILNKNHKFDLDDLSIGLDPDEYFKCYYHITMAYYELKEYDKCINFVKKIKNRQCWLILSNSFLAKKDYKKAILNYKKFISIPAHHSESYFPYYEYSNKEMYIAEAYFKIGYCYEKLNSINKAIKAYKKSIESCKWLQNSESAYYNLAVIYTKQKKYKQAIENYNECEKIYLEPIKSLHESSSISNKTIIQKYTKRLNYLYFNRGNVFLELANYNCALKDFKKALDYDATDLQAISNIIDIYRKQKNIEKIKEYTNLLLNNNGHPISRYIETIKNKGYIGHMSKGLFNWLNSNRKKNIGKIKEHTNSSNSNRKQKNIEKNKEYRKLLKSEIINVN